MKEVLNTFIGQIIALITFFMFPAIQYLILKRFTLSEGVPRLAFIPGFTFRVVMKNSSGKHTLSKIKYRALLRNIMDPFLESTSYTMVDDLLHVRNDFFLFPGSDQILVAFKLEGTSVDNLDFIYTDIVGNELRKIPLRKFGSLVCDYQATVENWFNFNFRLSKRVVITSDSLKNAWQIIQDKGANKELVFNFDDISSMC